MKKTLSFLLALTMLLCAFPFSAFATQSINEVHIAIDEPKQSVKAYNDIPTVPDEYRMQYSISKWYWCNMNTGKKLKEDSTFYKDYFYSLVLVLKSDGTYNFANDTLKHLFTFVADGVEANKYSISITKYEAEELGKSAVVKIDFDAQKEAPEIKINSLPSLEEGAKNTYNLSYGTYTKSVSNYDNSTTIKNGVMWEDITDPESVTPMNIGDTFLSGHIYRFTVYAGTINNFKYDFSLGKVYLGSALATNVQPLDMDSKGFVTRIKIVYDYKAVPHTKHNWVVTNVVPATMEADGAKSTQCSICGACVADTVIPRITISRYPNENFIYYKNSYYSMGYPFVSYSSSPYVYRNLEVGKDYDVTLSGTGQLTYSYNTISLKSLALGTHTLKIVFKGDYAGTFERKITVSLATPKPERVAGKTAIKLSWKAIDGATFYRVFEKDIKTGKVKCLASKVTGTAFVVKNKSMGTQYKFAVRAYRTTKAGKTYCSDYQFKDYYTRCGAPTILKAKVTGNKVTLTYTKVKGATSYSAYKYNAGKEVYEYFRGYSKTNTITFSAIKGTYYFKVSANDSHNGTVASNFSKPVKVVVK